MNRVILQMLLSLLALLAAGVANAETTVVHTRQWRQMPPSKLPDYSVQVVRDARRSDAHAVYQPVYRIRFPNGDVVDLPPMAVIPNIQLSEREMNSAVEDARFMLEGAIRLLASGTMYSNAIVYGDYVFSQKLDPDWLRSKNAIEFDPLTNYFARRRNIANAKTEDAVPEISRSRFLAVVKWLVDAIFISTVDAWQVYRAHAAQTKKSETGIQILLRAEFQLGIGKFNIMRSFPIDFSIGLDRSKRQLVFRRGRRSEKMLGGTATSLAVKAEFKIYRANPDIIDSGDARPGYGSFQGESWYPPFPVPAVSLVADSGRGFQSFGFVTSFNLGDVIPGSYLLNTVNQYTETQIALYSAPLPDRAEFFGRLQAQVDASTAAFGRNFVRGGRCDLLFKSAF